VRIARLRHDERSAQRDHALGIGKTKDFTSITATEPAQLTASAAAALIQTKQLSCEELARSCLARIAARDADVKTWLSIDPDHVIRRARELDKLPEQRGPLHGLPFGVKDVIDTADYPATHNSPIYDGLRMGKDAAPVAVVRGSGALILGKTDTVEFASGGRKALTRNPYNLNHTPADRPPARAQPSAISRCRWHLARKQADRISARLRSTGYTGSSRHGTWSAGRGALTNGGTDKWGQ
jgi:hypothetical protein